MGVERQNSYTHLVSTIHKELLPVWTHLDTRNLQPVWRMYLFLICPKLPYELVEALYRRSEFRKE